MNVRTISIGAAIGWLVGCASSPQWPMAEWRGLPGVSLVGPACAAPPSGAGPVLEARLAPLEAIIERSATSAGKVAAVRELEPAFEEFRLAEIAACRLLRGQRITLAQYDAFLDSVAVRLPATDAGE